MTEKDIDAFPDDFFWGASTASHQVEGNTVNQWSVWELAQASDRARNAQARLDWMPKWPDIRREATDPANYVSDTGVEHFTRYKEDFKILKALNFNSFRCGIEWSRIEPQEGVWDEEVIDHYRRYFRELKNLGIEPFVNIWHWTNPVWFEEKGAFTKSVNLPYFERFVAKVADSLLDDVTYVLTINEANNYASYSYILGAWPPGEKNVLKGLQVYRNLMKAHRRAYDILKIENPELQIGAAHNVAYNVPVSRKNPLEWVMAAVADYFWHGWWFWRIRDYQDFVGMNFYYVNHISWAGLKNPKEPLNDMGWYMEPSGVYGVIMQAHKKYKKPIMITENGVPDADDSHRQWWIEETVKGMNRALKDGADLKGYFHWSLLDNFEWAEGWWPKFGLVAVDRKTMKRTVRPSAKWFGILLKKIRNLK
jgi:beta-glucosidase